MNMKYMYNMQNQICTSIKNMNKFAFYMQTYALFA